MEQIKSFLEVAKLARKQAYKNLTVFPLLAPDGVKPDYLTLEQALGEELVGGKQDRIVNSSFLIAGKTEVVIPVSCVEQGCWSKI